MRARRALAWRRTASSISAGHYLAELAVVFAAYGVSGRIGLEVPFTSGNVSPVWPAAGIAVAALLLLGYRVWPAIATAAFLVNFFTPIPPAAAAGLAAGNTAGPLVAAWLTRRIPGFDASLNRLTDALGIILLAAPVGAAISAALGTMVLFNAGVNPWGTFGSAWRVWWLGDAMGVLILSPLLLTVSTRRQSLLSTRDAAELVVLVVTLVAACLLMLRPTAGVQHGVVLAAALTPFVLWGAIRFEAFGATIVVFLVSSLVIWKTSLGAGPFADGTAAEGALLLQAFLALLAVSGLTLAAVIGERAHPIREQARRAEEESHRARGTVLLLSQAVEQTADSVILTDSSGRIEYVNPAFESTTGYTREEAVGCTPRLLKSGQHDERFYQEMWNHLLRGEPYRGTLVNRRKNGEHYWAEQTITPMQDASGRIVHFVSVVKDMTEARAHQEQQVQLKLARQVQQQLYRAAILVPGFEIAAAAHPAEQTGGDYFDVIESPDGRCYIAIGDVSGHGLDAALVMAMTRAYIRSFATLGLDVGEILTRVNEVLVADLQENRFVTLLLTRLDPRSRTLEWASAGHMPGYLLNRAGGTDAMLESTGVPLGLFLESRFPVRSCLLETGHLLLLSTDGASETSTASDVEFGCDGVLEYVRTHLADDPRAIAEGIHHAARSFAAGRPQIDDITSVIVRVSSCPGAIEFAEPVGPCEATSRGRDASRIGDRS